MFKRILVAARGEIAVRIIRCCREMDIETVAVYSEADSKALHTVLATRAVCIGPAKATQSYLRSDVLIEVALRTGCEAVHPGYGFLSENADFAEKCAENNLVFIGPDAEVIRNMGDKLAARNLMKKIGMPVVMGSDGIIKDSEEAKEAAMAIGYPVLIKASGGGGGKGMRKAFCEDELTSAFETAAAEAGAAFGNDDMYMERLIQSPHHIEIQILADGQGGCIYLGERECSIQKNNQKLLEETPSVSVDEELRKKMGELATAAALTVGYKGAGTVEFVMDNDKNIYFIEMNTRIQVEHPITEEVTGIDLVKEQIRIAAGMKLSMTQGDVAISGHAIECRINALSTGRIEFLHVPAGYGVRVESHIFVGYEISPYYDSMLAKVIVKGRTRLEAVRRMRRALEELVIEGVKTNREFMHLLTYHPDFLRGRYLTDFYEKNHKEIEGWLETAGLAK